VFIKGPESSPALKLSAALPRPVVAYQLDKPVHSSAYAASRGQQHTQSHISLEMDAGNVQHDIPAQRRGLRTEEQDRAFATVSAEVMGASATANQRRRDAFNSQFSIS